MKNCLKIALGFAVAFSAFQFSQSGAFLAWAGALIWFTITGARNWLQAAAIGGFAWRRGWQGLNRQFTWRQTADSLLFTGFSVPLLDIAVKTWLLEKTCGFSVNTHPEIVFGGMAAVNGIYIAAHNFYRGFPRGAILGNLGRSALAAPLALFYNFIFVAALHALGVSAAGASQQRWAAVLAKAASDTVGGIIETLAGRGRLRQRRRRDFSQLLRHYFSTCRAIAKTRPDFFHSPASVAALQNLPERRRLLTQALDLFYLTQAKPHGQQALRRVYGKLSARRQGWLRWVLQLVAAEQLVDEFVRQELPAQAQAPLQKLLRKKRPAYLDVPYRWRTRTLRQNR